MKRYLIASIICWSIFLLLLIYCCSGCATPAYSAAYNANRQVENLAVQCINASPFSEIESVKQNKRFKANCQTYAKTVAAVLIDNGADPADVWLVVAFVKLPGIQFWNMGEGMKQTTEMRHMVVFFKGYIIDNRKPHIAEPGYLGYRWHIARRVGSDEWRGVDFRMMGGAS